MSRARHADIAPIARRERRVIGMIGLPATALKQTRFQSARALTIRLGELLYVNIRGLHRDEKSQNPGLYK